VERVLSARAGIGGPVALAVSLAIALGLPAAAVAGNSLVISPASLARQGWRAASGSVRAARGQLDSGLPRSLARVVARAGVQASAARKAPAETLASDAFVLSSSGVAHRVVMTWEHSHHAQALNLGQDGGIAQGRAGSGVLFSIVWREGARVGLLQVRLGAGATSDLATAFAPLADFALRTVLPSSAYGKVLAQIRPDGSVSEQTALQAFALSYGSLPGVHPPSGARSTIFSGTLAGAWVLRYLSRLSPRLRAVVLQRLGFSGIGTARAASYGDPNFVPSASLTAAAKAWRDKEADHIGPLLLTIVAGISPLSANDAYPVDAKGNYNVKGPFCLIRITPGTAGGSAAYLKLTLAHEVFHCFEFDFNPSWGSLGP
jgi:hypothetical protein